MKMKFKKQMKRSVVFVLALLLAATSSFAVYAAVNYDSSKDPVVSLSGMIAYVESALKDIKASLTSLEDRMTLLELVGPGSSGGSSSGGTGISAAQLRELLSRIEALEEANKELEGMNNAIAKNLENARNEYKSLIDELTKSYEEAETALLSLGTDITNLQNQLTTAKNDVATLQKNFKQISDISTKLETVTYKVNQLTGTSGDIAKLKKETEELKKQLNDVLGELGQIYEPVFVPYGATIFATDENDTVSLILRSGSAVAISPFTEAGTMQGLNDLSLGSDLYDGDLVPLFHHILIPRGGEDGRGITVTSVDGAYFLLGGDYKIVEKQ